MKSGIYIRADGKTIDLVDSFGDARDWCEQQDKDTLIRTIAHLLGLLSTIENNPSESVL